MARHPASTPACQPAPMPPRQPASLCYKAPMPLRRLITFEDPRPAKPVEPEEPPVRRPAPATVASPAWCRWWAEAFDADAETWRERPPRRR